jgi:hypothetical protein
MGGTSDHEPKNRTKNRIHRTDLSNRSRRDLVNTVHKYIYVKCRWERTAKEKSGHSHYTRA